MEYINDPDKEFLNNLILSKTGITEQLRLLRKYRDRKDVQEYIKGVEESSLFSNWKYTRYLIGRYYHNDRNAIKPEKNTLESISKLQLQPVQLLKKEMYQ